MERIKNKKSFSLTPIIVGIMFLLGAGVFLYPTISNYFAEKNSSRKVDEYSNIVAGFDEETIALEKQKAIEYNESLIGEPVRDPFIEGSGMALPENYLDVLRIGEDNMMCFVEIPKINVKLPVYHGVSKEVLDKGARSYEGNCPSHWWNWVSSYYYCTYWCCSCKTLY